MRIIAESAGLEWRWRDKDGNLLEEGTWVGTCDVVSTVDDVTPTLEFMGKFAEIDTENPLDFEMFGRDISVHVL